MLRLTLVSRRCAQKPLRIVTARTGTWCSLAWGERVRFSMAWFFQSAACSAGASGVPPLWEEENAGPVVPNARAAEKEEAAAAAATAEVTNWRREMVFLPMRFLQGSQRPGVAAGNPANG